MPAIIHGRVVSVNGVPAAGATVWLRPWAAPIYLSGEKAPEKWMEPLISATDERGDFTFSSDEDPALINMLKEGLTCLRATSGTQVSKALILPRGISEARVPPLCLEDGVLGQVVVVWPELTPVVGARVSVTIRYEAMPGEDPRASDIEFEGMTSAEGVIAFGPTVAGYFRSITLSVTHHDAPPHSDSRSGGQLTHDVRFSVMLARGRTIRGALLDAHGGVAVGFRVVPGTTIVQHRHMVRSDAAGRFAIRGLPVDGGIVAIYPPRNAAGIPGDEALVDPLLIQDVGPGNEDLGTIVLPRTSSLAIRIVDSRGLPVPAGRVAWLHAGRVHGHRYARTDSRGQVQLHVVPQAVPLELRATRVDPDYGEVTQLFRIDSAPERRMSLHLTGAGTIIVRFIADRKSRRPFLVRNSMIEIDGRTVAEEEGPTSELRAWILPGKYGNVRIVSDGSRVREFHEFDIRRDGPTLLELLGDAP